MKELPPAVDFFNVTEWSFDLQRQLLTELHAFVEPIFLDEILNKMPPQWQQTLYGHLFETILYYRKQKLKQEEGYAVYLPESYERFARFATVCSPPCQRWKFYVNRAAAEVLRKILEDKKAVTNVSLILYAEAMKDPKEALERHTGEMEAALKILQA